MKKPIRAEERVQDIPLSRLFVSPEETRKTINQAALEELAASIAEKGVIENLLVRPESLDQADGEQCYEIVAGQRRWLASKIALKGTCPCIVREMADEEARELRTISNLQREDLPPLEEALAFSALLSVPGATVETVAAKLAKSPSYVGRRLQLLKAIEPVREALKAGAIEVGHALELARLDEKQQIRHLSRLNCGYVTSAKENNRFADDENDLDDDFDEEDPFESEASDVDGASPGTWKPTDSSVAELRREIARTTLRVLSDAPFPLEDELPPMACTECPKRSGNAALLFDDCAQDTCTDRECFDAKVKAWIKYELKQAYQQKRNLLMLSDGYCSNNAAIRDYDVAVIDGERRRACDLQEEAIWIDGPKAGHRVMICRDSACRAHKSAGGNLSSQSDPAKAKAERRKMLAKVSAGKIYRSALFTAIAKAKIPGVTPAALVSLVDYAIGRSDGTLKKKAASLLGWDAKLFEEYGEAANKRMREHLAALAPGDAVRSALLFSKSSELTVHEYAVSAKASGLEALAKIFGVDAKKVRAEVAPKADKPAAPAKKRASKNPTKTAAKKPPKKGGRK